MSHPSASSAPPPVPHLTGKSEIRIVSHSNLFYWWPVWAVGYLMAIFTLIDGHKLAIVPRGTEVAHITEKVKAELKGSGEKVDIGNRDVLAPDSSDKRLQEPTSQMAKNKNLGVIFAIVLLLVIAITNIPLRGLWSVIVIVIIILGSV